MKFTGVNAVNRICNVLNALDPQGSQAGTLYRTFLNHAVHKKVLTSPYIGDTGVLQTFLYDAMEQLILMVLNKDDGLDPDIRAGIAADIEPIRKQKDATVQTQMELMKNEMEYMTSLTVKHLASVGKAWTWKGLDSMFQQIEGSIKGVPTAYPKAFQALRVATIIGLVGRR